MQASGLPPTPSGTPADALAVELAVTIRHDGHGGVADDLSDPAGLTDLVRRRADAFDGVLDAARFSADEAVLGEVRELRAAVRALFARAVRPGPVSSADADRLLPVAEAVGRLNAAAALVPTAARLEWPEGGAPVVRTETAALAPDRDRPAAALARAAIGFLAGPDRERLRACPAPRCVRYFVKEHPRQEWCKPSCGNRARVARHQRRHRTAP
ncbi:CGNR zinc finger domain-containing protein [Streptomyces sp. H27-D2]|uniref:CGNR zinc finger domain-containing protein n=1 Tax=Streptomyces sp. H27-D2 TaxID=3046304 RepID=UPI002DB9458E|nr:CGNR zinc finger domain-containing protein [Streptomyces sp. H27-D2]MEC4018515.1 CGNR zinc finger domain-containing protein [Streptomyces sp. H27-D2]